MPAPKKAVDAAPMGYLKNKEGRVFIATPALVKQMQKGKFGLIRITKEVYDNAVKNGFMTEPEPELDDAE